MRLIGLSGLAGAGKSEAAKALVTHEGYVEVGLADEMKRIIMRIFPAWDESVMWGPSAIRNAPDHRYGGCSPRRALQLLGTEFGRGAYQDVWVDMAIRTARDLTSYASSRVEYSRTFGLFDAPTWTPRPTGIAIPDCRFRNELEAIQAAGGHVIRIVRLGAGLTGDAGQHASEVEQIGIRDDEFDAVILNNGSIDDLHDRVREAARSVLGEAA